MKKTHLFTEKTARRGVTSGKTTGLGSFYWLKPTMQVNTPDEVVHGGWLKIVMINRLVSTRINDY